ncbi:MAG: L-aspartate oxidase [Bacteroidota bacterium]|nr:L-aspartate oxidase [Bacteroidota bacterium]MDP4230848.1 L-aspartate oxidase [Bacteroidota bacterium]MDP4235660.1 L-aspartate oxidase [Bacteroidota bacterium]
MISTDILVLGSGSAGLFFALQVAKRSKLRIHIITKKERSESNTNYAQGGIASVMNEHDSYESHIRDTLIAGAGLCHEDAVRVLVEEGPQRIQDLIDLGTQFTHDESGKLHLGKEGGHSANRIVHTRDLTGKEIERSLLSAIASHPQITLLEDHFAVELLTDHQRIDKKKRKKDPITCYGAYILDEKSGKVEIVRAKKAVMLATGGAGQVYLHTTNPMIATADGVAMGYRAGAVVGNLEFIQFHPTTLYAEGARSFLISEAVRGAGGILRNLAGERFMAEYDPFRMELAPRDIVARAIDAELKHRGEQYVLLDISHLPAEKIKKEFPNIYEKCKLFGIDITKDPIPVVPAAHYSCGGVVTDLVGRTNLSNLYACGEVTMTGVHGANRLASNSLLESLVFSYRAANDLTDSLKTRPKEEEKVKLVEWDDSGTENAEEWVVIEHDRREVQQLMWDYVGIVRSTYRLKRSERRLKLISEEIEAYYRKTKVTVPLLELRNITLAALLIVRSALKRKESRGLHYMTDYPEPKPALGKKDTILQKKV